ncbi:hypothetical protein [uncultured Draconibacterium sp.]|uniref:Cbp1 family collagen-binding glycoprotein adhesin n=1 Tax=uncultured Draconibacterium sp. TaxID=1573823 RepID=UPI0025CD6185|nr:hypothetical protein [uncultured Draconibacterium sp.]
MKSNRKIQNAISAFLVVVIIGAALVGISIYTKKNTEIDSLQSSNVNINQELQERDSMVNELLGAFDEIEQNLKYIKEKRQVLSIESQTEGNYDKKKAIVEDISLMNEMLEKSSEHIAELERKLQKSGIQISSLKKKIETLNQSVEEQNTQIIALQQQIEKRDEMLAQLNRQVDDMQVEISKQVDTLKIKQQLIEEKTYQLNKGFVAYGTYKELEENGVLTKNGGFLGLGKHISLKKNLDQDYFTELNIRDTKSIPLFSNKATIISEHPDSSYTFIEQDGVIAYLNIDNPDEFWKISKYAVIEIK